MSSAQPTPGEKRILQEDCAEDNLNDGNFIKKDGECGPKRFP
jgi:hypothetical protein